MIPGVEKSGRPAPSGHGSVTLVRFRRGRFVFRSRDWAQRSLLSRDADLTRFTRHEVIFE
jgi:hypothetical protein